MIWIVLFIVSVGLLGYSYLIYPMLMKWLARGKKLSNVEPDIWPFVSVIIAVYNEENVLEEKLQCLENLDYPSDYIHVYFGSDNSSDSSNDILKAYSEGRKNVTFIPFDKRQGKVGVINKLGTLALQSRGKKEDHILLYNDANVMLTTSTLKTMVRHFRNEQVALVDANMRSRKVKREGISLAEKAYITSEVVLKHNEGLVWGMLQGAFGGCYCLRSTYHSMVPEGFLVDDFFISFKAMVKGGKAINDLEALCYESASHDIWQEYSRKARISSGNYQNLRYFLTRKLAIPGKLLFCFFSHKVIRWFGPFLLGVMFISAIGMFLTDPDVISLMILITILCVLFIIPIVDFIFLRFGLHVSLLRKVRYFIIMNIALLKGFIRYAKGIQTSFWDPPKRV